jgi:hypothetical protein
MCVNGFCQLAAALSSSGSGRFLTSTDTARLADSVGKALEALNRPVLSVSTVLPTITTASSPWISTYTMRAESIRSNARAVGSSLDEAERTIALGGDPTRAVQEAIRQRAQLQSDLTMIAQAATAIQQEQLVLWPGCPAVFQAAQGILAETAATILGREISTDAWPQSRAGWPIEYAYIATDLRCGPSSEPVRLLSQVFGFCAPEMSTTRILADNALILDQVKRASCPAPIREVTSPVYRHNSPSEAEQARARSARVTGWRIVPWTASVDVYVRACK